MIAILPAAGYATRMGELTKDRSKALLEVQGRPLIEYSLSKLTKFDGIDEIRIVTNNRFYEDFLRWREGYRTNKRITIINDGTNNNDERLGSIKDVYLALDDESKGSFIVVNPDNMFTFDLNEIYQKFKKSMNTYLGLYDVKTKEQARKLGNPELDNEQKFVGFNEKDSDPKSTICTVGIYFFPTSVRQDMSKYLFEGHNIDRFGDFISYLYKRKDIYGHVFSSDNDWQDIGSIEGYNKAQENPGIERFL